MENLKQLLENIGNNETRYLAGERIDVYADALTQEDRFYPGYGSTRGYCFAIRNKKNITIDSQGAELVFHGASSPFLFSNCESVTLKNLKINYAVPGYTCGKITQVTDDFYDLDFSADNFSADVTADGSLHFIDPNRERESLIRFTIVDELDAHAHLQVNMSSRYFLRLDPYAPGTRLSHMFRMARFE